MIWYNDGYVLRDISHLKWLFVLFYHISAHVSSNLYMRVKRWNYQIISRCNVAD